MEFLYVPKDTDLFTLIKGDASIADVGYAVVNDGEWEMTVETSQKRFRKILSMGITDRYVLILVTCGIFTTR